MVRIIRYNEYGWLGYFSLLVSIPELLVQATIHNHTIFEFRVYTFSEELNKLKTAQNGMISRFFFFLKNFYKRTKKDRNNFYLRTKVEGNFYNLVMLH